MILEARRHCSPQRSIASTKRRTGTCDHLQALGFYFSSTRAQPARARSGLPLGFATQPVLPLGLTAAGGALGIVAPYSHSGGLPPTKRDQLWEHMVYIANNKDRMRYVTLSSCNLPICSGVTESAAKTVVGRRAKNSGQRWSQPGLRGALTLRAIQQSDRLPRFWAHLSRRYVANVAAAA